MILIGYSWFNVLMGMLWVILALFIIVIAYKKLLAYLGRKNIDNRQYCTLYDLEVSPASGILPFYFTAPRVLDYQLNILDLNMKVVKEVANQKCAVDGNIIRFDSTKIPNGEYFYSLETEVQKVVKKMTVFN